MTSRQGVTRSVLGCGFALLVGCGSSDHGPFVAPPAGGGASGAANRAGAGGSSTPNFPSYSVVNNAQTHMSGSTASFTQNLID